MSKLADTISIRFRRFTASCGESPPPTLRHPTRREVGSGGRATPHLAPAGRFSEPLKFLSTPLKFLSNPFKFL